MVRSTWLFAWWSCVFLGRAAAADFSEARVRTWLPDNGLPTVSVECLLAGRDGCLWIGTREGLARFDGRVFTSYAGHTPGFTDDAITTLAEDPEGRLWIGTKRGLYCRFRGNFTRFSTADGLLHDHVRALLTDADGGAWVATGAGINRFREGRWQRFPFQAPAAARVGDGYDSETFAVGRGPAGELLVGTGAGLQRLIPETGLYEEVWRSREEPNGSPANAVRAVLTSSDGALWFASDLAVHRRLGDGRADAFALPAAAIDLRMRQLIEAPDGRVWVRALSAFVFNVLPRAPRFRW